MVACPPNETPPSSLLGVPSLHHQLPSVINLPTVASLNTVLQWIQMIAALSRELSLKRV